MRRLRQWALAVLVGTLAVGALGQNDGRAEASHSFSVIAVRDVECYRHVLETDDRLCLTRYALAESPVAPEAAYGRGGAILKAQDGATVLDQQNPPVAGYGLAAFYWTAVDASSSIPWELAGFQVCIEGNPTLFSTPATHCDSSPNWNSESDLAATAKELENDLPNIMLDLEQDDPDVASGTYVASVGITLTGQGKIEMAFAQLSSIAAGAFSFGLGAAGDDFAPPGITPGSFASTTITNAKSAWAEDLEDLGEAFGFPFIAIGLLLLVFMMVGLGLLIRVTGGAQEVLLIYVGPVLLFGGLIGSPPFMVVVALIAAAALLGSAAFVNRHWPS